MKKYIATVWAIAALTVMVSTVRTSNAEAQLFSHPSLDFQTLTTKLSTPEDLAKYMWRNFRYENDQSNFGKAEYWQSPEEFMENKAGDCEDFALFASEILKQQGKKTFLLNIYGSGFAHTICVFVENGKYNAMDGTDVKRINANDLPSLMNEIYPQWKKGAIVAKAGKSNKGCILKKFEREAKIGRAFASSL
ncbi:MAG TPA: transglutaminase-like domain-containing protein [Verrucomicrobiae bacterium]|jgi:hypothetical protein|nr:transglutaminase-like domain-containing protein [Verrucomicrobiae bacterium]